MSAPRQASHDIAGSRTRDVPSFTLKTVAIVFIFVSWQ